MDLSQAEVDEARHIGRKHGEESCRLLLMTRALARAEQDKVSFADAHRKVAREMPEYGWGGWKGRYPRRFWQRLSSGNKVNLALAKEFEGYLDAAADNAWRQVIEDTINASIIEESKTWTAPDWARLTEAMKNLADKLDLLLEKPLEEKPLEEKPLEEKDENRNT